jgi:hypothetical protein
MKAMTTIVGLLAMVLMNPSLAQISPFLASVEIEATAGKSATGRLLLDRYLRCRNGDSSWQIEGNPLNFMAYPYAVTLTVNTMPSQACTRQIGPDRYNTPALTLPLAGFYQLRIVDEYGTEIGRQTITAKSNTQLFSRFDVAGNWYQPSTSGSGLILTQQRSGGSDALFGVWHAYETDGSSSWHSLQNTVWRTPTLASGTLYRTFGGNCGASNCGTLPSSATQVADIGTFEIESTSADQAVLRMRNREGLIFQLDIPLQRLQ